MTTLTTGIRDIARNVNMLQEYDYIEVEDKKTHEYKGLFLSPKYAKEFKAYLEDKKAKEIEAKLERFKKYAGKGTIDSKFNNLTGPQLRQKIADEKYNNE
ncbi:MAG: hypothetical protein U9N49_04360 [Campylobacterota bacterium]|nr:hypothetical protein [Campylobacterota bacterium]